MKMLNLLIIWKFGLKGKKINKVEKTTWDGYYNSTIKHLIPYFEPLNLNIKDLKPKHIVDYYNYKFSHGRCYGKAGGLSNKSIKEHSIVIKNALDSALIEKLIDKNPAAHVPLPKRNEQQNRYF